MVVSFRGSISSYTKISRNSSFRHDSGGSQTGQSGHRKEKSSVFRNLVNNLKQKSVDEGSTSGAGMERMTSKTSRYPTPNFVIVSWFDYRRSGLSVGNIDDTVKFKLVEDLNLVTIPITTCVLVLIGYIMCGAALFSAWEVGHLNMTIWQFCFLIWGLDCAWWSLFLFYKFDDNRIWRLCAWKFLHL